GTTADALTYNSQGSFVVHWSFDDGHGNISTANQNVIVHDVTAPVAPTLADATGECTVTLTPPIASDICRESLTLHAADALTYNRQGSFVLNSRFVHEHRHIRTANQNVIVHDVTAAVAPTLADATGE